MMVLSIAAMVLMTRKYVENWLLWVIINVISVGDIRSTGRVCDVAGIFADVHCPEWQPDGLTARVERGSHALSR